MALNTCVKTIWIAIIIAWLTSLPFTLCAQLSEQSSISLITCRPGDEIDSGFGHTAIRITDPILKIDYLFNYGMFSFDEPNFVLKFVRGKLSYWLGLEQYKPFADNYSRQKRSVIEQKLNLSLEGKNKIFNALKENIKPENRRYLYDFFFDNCSTRPRDIILNTIVGEQFDSSKISHISFRSLLDEYTRSKPWTDFGIDLVIGSIADKKTSYHEQMFLPEYLMHHLDSIYINDQTLVKEKLVLIDYEGEVQRRNNDSVPWPVIIFLVFLLIEISLFVKPSILNNRVKSAYDKLWYGLIGLGGLILLFMWFGTDHIATKKNFNLLWMNPLALTFVRKHKNKIPYFLALTMLTLALVQSPFIQNLHIASVILIIILILKLLRNFKENSKI